ncbi:hypothetical protein HF329_09535 [Chitinophaga oryzae]|uniref:Fungal lipase-type domain-containing protein n=1 Tax=Chitinophaga oryzae TaxID=2725414 RepID=A0AAE6ZEK6_9BACT|nr:hypothetical protein [Chitinophaga oryzae]QJB31535.1 hypothetical protein HF329_09535 [Chitinophaga oryzae]
MAQTNSAPEATALATSIDVPLASLEMIAAQANIYDLFDDGPSLPPGWDVIIQPFRNDPATDKVVPIPSQGYMVKITVQDSEYNNVQVDILAVGISWLKFLLYQYDGAFNMETLPADIAGKSIPATAQVLSMYSIAYQFLRRPIWNAVTKREDPSRPLYICGYGLGAPLAQIAALDLRIGNQGPADPNTGIKPNAPSTPTPCYTFTNASFANSGMAAYYTNTITAPVTVTRAGNAGNDVDQWPNSPSGFSLLGTYNPVNASLDPNADDPWWERATIYYTQTLNGSPIPNDPEPVNINPPAGFSRDMAFSLSKLAMLSYHWAQHPDSSGGNAPANYQYVTKIDSNGSTWAYLFKGDTNNSIVVVFRGEINWTEFNTCTALTGFTMPPWSPMGSAQVNIGAYNIYAGLANALQTALQPYSTRDLYFTGHSFGGAIANIAASNYAISKIQKVKAVYTFGALMSANADFSTVFNNALGSNSYQIRRPDDILAIGFMSIGYYEVNTPVLLQGQLKYEDPDYHNLLNYMKLLDTARV